MEPYDHIFRLNQCGCPNKTCPNSITAVTAQSHPSHQAFAARWKGNSIWTSGRHQNQANSRRDIAADHRAAAPACVLPCDTGDVCPPSRGASGWWPASRQVYLVAVYACQWIDPSWPCNRATESSTVGWDAGAAPASCLYARAAPNRTRR